MKNVIVYWLKKPTVHIYWDDFIVEFSLGFVNVLFVRGDK